MAGFERDRVAGALGGDRRLGDRGDGLGPRHLDARGARELERPLLVDHRQRRLLVDLDRRVAQGRDIGPATSDELDALIGARQDHAAPGTPFEPFEEAILNPRPHADVGEFPAVSGVAECVVRVAETVDGDAVRLEAPGHGERDHAARQEYRRRVRVRRARAQPASGRSLCSTPFSSRRSSTHAFENSPRLTASV